MDGTHLSFQRKRRRKKPVDDSIPLIACSESPVSVSASHGADLSSDSILMAKRVSAEAVRAKSVAKVWYEFESAQGLVSFAEWNPLLSEFAIDFPLMWNTVVRGELQARAALSRWRTRPCKRIGTRLPDGFSSWTEFRARRGIQDESTGVSSLSDTDLNHFWNDQCACTPSCWRLADSDESDAPLPSCLCKQDTCVCDAPVPFAVELQELKRVRCLYPFGGRALDARIEQLESTHPVAKTYRDMLQVTHGLRNERQRLRETGWESETLARRCVSFWWSLEQQFLTETRKFPISAVELLRWFWSGKEEFVTAFRSRVGAHALSYL